MSANMAPEPESRFLVAVFAKRERGLTLWIALALCPNCHREVYGEERVAPAYFIACLLFNPLNFAVQGDMMLSDGET